MDTTVTKSEIIEIYKILLEQEQNNNTTFITVLLAIVVVILGATWWWNKVGAEKYIKNSVSKGLEESKGEFSELINNQIEIKVKSEIDIIENRINNIELDLYRTFAISIDSKMNFSHSTLYWTLAVEKAIILGEGRLLRAFCVQVIDNLKIIEPKELHGYEKIIEIIKTLPNTLEIEKNEILTLLGEFKNLK